MIFLPSTSFPTDVTNEVSNPFFARAIARSTVGPPGFRFGELQLARPPCTGKVLHSICVLKAAAPNRMKVGFEYAFDPSSIALAFIRETISKSVDSGIPCTLYKVAKRVR